MGSDPGFLYAWYLWMISIHAPRMGSDTSAKHGFTKSFVISIHAPRMGSDLQPPHPCAGNGGFQSTLPAWGATIPIHSEIWPLIISIHAPRMGSDISTFLTGGTTTNFNPRSPHGERLLLLPLRLSLMVFQSTLPAWGATKVNRVLQIFITISIHAPRMGSDVKHMNQKLIQRIFQSTLPAWGAT